jgi:heme/copper-type cytochrome/quinol oxidase subunit 3
MSEEQQLEGIALSQGVVLEPEPAETHPRNLAVGSRLISSAIAFFFMAFVFAFFYLRALNTAHSFLEPHVSPPVGWGVAILACVLLSCVTFELGRRSLADGTGSPWRRMSLLSWVLALAAIVLQLIEYYDLKFGATDGGFASVFFGFTAVFGAFWLASVYWVETLWAQSLRQPAAVEAVEVADPSRLLRPSADAAVVYLYTMGVVAIIAFFLLYVVE